MKSPIVTSPGSIMPSFTWLYDDVLDIEHTEGKIITMRKLGVPYAAGYESQAVADLKAQAEKITADLKTAGLDTPPDREIVAVIAYLQRLGVDIKSQPATPGASAQPVASATMAGGVR